MLFERVFRSFHTGNVGSLGQRAAKLLFVKLLEYFDMDGLKAWPHPLAHTLAVMAEAADFF